MVRKIIEVKKHPYMWKVQVTFGTLEDMLKNRYKWQKWNGIQVFVGGTFNEKMNETSRASLVELAVEFDVESFKCEKGILSINGIKSAKSIRYSCWEGTYCYSPSLFDEMMEKGLYPISADWDGNTYIERWSCSVKDKNGVPIPSKPHYELTEHYVY